MALDVLLVNPPVYDFSAYDFWMKPVGLLNAGGMLRSHARIRLFDFMDRLHPGAASTGKKMRFDNFGRGAFFSSVIEKPPVFASVPRRFKRFGLPQKVFQEFLEQNGDIDFVLIETGMTYWYPGIKEVIEDVRNLQPGAGIILGGTYATICPDHAAGLGADLVVKGLDLEPLWEFMQVRGDKSEPAFWEGYPGLDIGVLKISDGCPFNCTYCSVPHIYPRFSVRPFDKSKKDFELLIRLGVKQFAFYDDALLYNPDEMLIPFLECISAPGSGLNFHTPNALNARFVSERISEVMVGSGFKTFFLGFESKSEAWQKSTGGKVKRNEFVSAVDNIIAAGAERKNITAYLIAGHVHDNSQDLEDSMRFVNDLGIRIMLAEFSPIPGTVDGENCRSFIDMDEPLEHNKTSFVLKRLGKEKVDRLKQLCRDLNAKT